MWVWIGELRIFLSYFFSILVFKTENHNLLPFDITETKCSSLARSEAGTQKDPLSNGSTNPKTEANNQQIPASNGVPKTIVTPTTKTTMSVPAAAPATASADLLPKIPSFPENGDSKPKD